MSMFVYYVRMFKVLSNLAKLVYVSNIIVKSASVCTA